MISVKEADPRKFVAERRGDVLTDGHLSDATVQALNIVALTPESCRKQFKSCLEALASTTGLNPESQLSAQSELWLGEAIARPRSGASGDSSPAALDSYLQGARLAYAYLFLTRRSIEERALETRQSQVIGFYNYCVQRAVTILFATLPDLRTPWLGTEVAGWSVSRPSTDVTFGSRKLLPDKLTPSSDFKFDGLRSIYKRDGFGAEFVAVAHEGSAATSATPAPWREPLYASLTALLVFPGASLEEVMSTQQVQILGLDPYKNAGARIAGKSVPLAANYSAPYGVWLARSGFNRQSLWSLLGRKSGIATPQVLLMRPFDPDRLTVIMIHGLASSPEAWVNVGNELLGDEDVRNAYQVWEVYYPTNLEVPVNLANIRTAIDATIRHFDPDRSTIATRNMVLIGHSMGGVLARLLVSSSGDALRNVIPTRADLAPSELDRLHEQLRPYFEFSPMPEVTRAVFIAAPHRGTPSVQRSLARLVSRVIRLPASFLRENASLIESMRKDAPAGTPSRLPNGLEELSTKNRFMIAARDLPISPAVRYHTIVGINHSHSSTPTDGLVPYWSAHLPNAQSELAIPSGHSVQETPQAILEMRRILLLHAAEAGFAGPGSVR